MLAFAGLVLAFAIIGGVFQRLHQPAVPNRAIPVFAVMGETGTGKSAFIKALGGRSVRSGKQPKIGHDVYSCKFLCATICSVN